MHPLIAAAATSGGRLPSPVTILLVIVGVAYVMWSRMQGQPLKAKRLIVLPVLYMVLGVGDLTGATHETAADIVFLVISIGLSVLLGAARGSTIELFTREGELWQRYRASTVALWLTLIGSKVLISVVAAAAGASAGTNGLLFSLGVSLLAESAVVGPRALASGVPFASDRPESAHHSDPANPGVSHG